MTQIYPSIICTVFQGAYHVGVAALVNSLYARGYRGIVYAAYRGELPPWVKGAPGGADGITEHPVATDLVIHFALQDTDEMLANVKPEVIGQVWERYGPELENVFYIDCDIVIKAEWRHFETWASCGVALCEDMHSPVAKTHPLRIQWQRYYAAFGIDYLPRDAVYVNGGFVGINRKFRGFGALWGELQQHMKQHTGKQDRIGIGDRWNLFQLMDQDALNVAKDLTERISLMGKDAMDFGAFGYVMSHAAGRRKPWDKQFIREVIATGARPSFTDKLFWHSVETPIRVYPVATVRRKRMSLKVAAVIGRFFTRT